MIKKKKITNQFVKTFVLDLLELEIMRMSDRTRITWVYVLILYTHKHSLLYIYGSIYHPYLFLKELDFLPKG